MILTTAAECSMALT